MYFLFYFSHLNHDRLLYIYYVLNKNFLPILFHFIFLLIYLFQIQLRPRVDGIGFSANFGYSRRGVPNSIRFFAFSTPLKPLKTLEKLHFWYYTIHLLKKKIGMVWYQKSKKPYFLLIKSNRNGTGTSVLFYHFIVISGMLLLPKINTSVYGFSPLIMCPSTPIFMK